MDYMLSQNIDGSIQSIKFIALICFIVGSVAGICSCASDRATSVLDPATSPTLTSWASDPHGSKTTPSPQQIERSFALRGIWIHPQSVATQEKADETLARVQTGHLNTVFLLVFWDGYAYYDSVMAEKKLSLTTDYDPLGYVVAEAHRRGLQVHAWFVVGEIGIPYGEPGPVLSQHPEWVMLDASGGSQIHWLNFAHPDARQFISDLISEVVLNYDVDGVHLDYIRYPGSKWSFDPHSVTALANEYGVDLDSLRYAQLPAYGFFHGNPLFGVGTAQVLAKFDDGIPAVILNTYGQGKVVVLNWHAEDQQIAASSEILKRSIEALLGEGGEVCIFRSEVNEAEYGDTYFSKNKAWLESLGWAPVQVAEAGLTGLNSDSVVVLPNIYVMEASTVSELARFVENGGGLIFIDGPVRAMKYRDLRTLTGMWGRWRYFKGDRALLAVGESDLIPDSGWELDIQAYREQISRWDMFREESVTSLVQDVYRRVKREKPGVQVSAAVYRKQAWAAGVFQDWYGWLSDGYMDFVVPMAYVSEASSLEELINEWHTEGDLNRTMAGLAVADFNDRNRPSKTAGQVLTEVELLQRRGISGVILFDFEHITDDQLQALATGPFAP